MWYGGVLLIAQYRQFFTILYLMKWNKNQNLNLAAFKFFKFGVAIFYKMTKHTTLILHKPMYYISGTSLSLSETASPLLFSSDMLLFSERNGAAVSLFFGAVSPAPQAAGANTIHKAIVSKNIFSLLLNPIFLNSFVSFLKPPVNYFNKPFYTK